MADEKTERVATTVALSTLEDYIRKLGKAAVAFSGGVDSSLLLAASVRALGDAVTAVTVRSPFSLPRDLSDARSVAESLGARHVELALNELDDENVRENGTRRCYYCKRLRYARLVEYADAEGIPWILDGTNLDDLGDYRPGLDAVRENPRVLSPLLELGIDKATVRAMSQELNLSTWNKPAMACLATRIAVDTAIQPETLRAIAASEESIFEILGDEARNAQLRVRCHGDVARIEAEASLTAAILSHAEEIVRALGAGGFRYAALDLGGYKTGNMNMNQ